MATQEEVVTVFKADLSELEEAVGKYEKELGDASKASGQLDDSTKKLGVTVGQVAPKFNTVKASADNAAKSIANVGTATQQAAKSGGALNRLRGIFTSIGNGAKSALSSVGSLFSGIASGAASAIPSIGGIGGAFTGLLGPVGLAAGAIAGGLLAVVKNTDAGATALDGLGRTSGIVFDKITGALVRAQRSFLDLRDGTGFLSGAFDAVVTAGEKFTDLLSGGLIPLTKQLFKESIDQGQLLANLYDQLDDKEIIRIANAAEQERQVNRLNIQLRDRTKTEEERLAIADKLTRIERQRAQEDLQIQRDRTNLLKLQAKQQSDAKGEVDDALRRQVEEAIAAETRIAQESESIIERAQNRRNAIQADGDAKREQARQKALEAERKAAPESLRMAQEKAKAEEGIARIVEAAQFETAQAARTEGEQELAVIRKKYADIEAEAERHFEALRALTPASEQSALAAREANALIAIDAAKKAAIEASTKARYDKEKEMRDERLKEVNDSLKTEVQLGKDSINERFDTLEKYAKEVIDDEATLNATLEALAKQRAKVLYDIEKESADKTLAERQRAAQATVQLFADGLNAVQQLVDASYDRRIEAATSREAQLQQALERAVTDQEKTRIESEIKQTQDQKAQLEKRKKQAQAFAIAATLIATYQAAQQAYLSQFIPGDPTSSIRAAVAAAIAVALGLANVAKIKSAVPGAYEGEEYVDGKPHRKGKDGHLRWTNKGERIITTDKNERYWEPLDAIHKGRFDEYIDRTYVAPLIAQLEHRDDGRVTEFMRSDTGSRIASSVMLAKYYDANIVNELKASRKQSRQQTELLGAIAKNFRQRSSRYW